MDHYLLLDLGAHPFGLSMPNASAGNSSNWRRQISAGIDQSGTNTIVRAPPCAWLCPASRDESFTPSLV